MELKASSEVKLPLHFPIRFSQIAEKTETPATTLESLEKDENFNKKSGIRRTVQLYTIELWFDNKCFNQRGKKGSFHDNHCEPDHHKG
ncbi:hypothetical protein AVEN_3575-1 [Araneus ventricosus]|uniref:Uncharacterized protein n=1 Tax=Araneus ventricosus TaxID=182803 RepID=A0A4Y2V0W0_ARAVE|nr:hypothetical protein AVEN_3575-1 [Araneus ventricosus]